jgi:hypothetical protein
VSGRARAGRIARAIARLAARAIVAAALVAIVLEGSARIASRLRGDGGTAAAALEREAFLARSIGTARLLEPPATPGQRVVAMAYGARYELHPYFGHTFFRGEPGVNNHGFVTPHEYPYARTGDELVVGVFGGSVAMQVAAGDRLADRLAPLAHGRGRSRVVVLPFAVGGWREPQPFHALVHYLSDVDVVVFVDGFNEAIQLGTQRLASYPASYPPSDIFGGLAAAEDSPYAARDRALLSVAGEAMARATALAGSPPLDRSAFAQELWRLAAARYDRLAASVRKAGDEAASRGWAGIDVVRAPGDIERSRDRYFALYASVLRDAARLSAAAGKPFFHFVQPNQHLSGAKPFSEEERATAVTPAWFDIVTPGYLRIEQLSADLRRDGVDSTFLGWLFAAETATVYGDACCHFNERGLDALVSAIAQRMLAAEGSSRRAPAACPPSAS